MAATRKRVESILVGSTILAALANESRRLSLSEIARRTQMSPSKAHAYLTSFLEVDFVDRDSDNGHYGLGTFALRLGAAAIRQSDLIALSRETLAELRRETTCTVFLSIWGNRGPTIVHKDDGRWMLSPIQVGFVLPVLGSATGNVFLAHLPAHDTDALVQSELRASLEPESVVGEIVESVQRFGFAGMKVPQQYSGVAAPILRSDGTIAAALTVSRPREVIDMKLRRSLGQAALAAAQTLSQRLGASS